VQPFVFIKVVQRPFNEMKIKQAWRLGFVEPISGKMAYQ
jgi:hypothetical protein